MVKNFLLTIFISILTIGCDNQITGPIDWEEYYEEEEPTCEPQYFLQVESYLPMENGYYIMEYLQNWDQTFTTLTAKTGSTDNIQLVSWSTMQGMYVPSSGVYVSEDSSGDVDYWVMATNGISYTDEIGEAHTVLSAIQSFVGDTVDVHASFTDICNNNYTDMIKVIVRNAD